MLRTPSDLIGSIYDCALDPSHWERTLADLLEVMAGESVILSLNDLRHDRLLIDKSVGWGQNGIEERQKHVPEIHARLKEWFAKAPSPDQPFVASRELSPDYMANAAYVQDCLKPRGIVDVMHLFLIRTPTHFSEIVVGRHQRHGIITERELELGMLLLPHLRRAVTISNVLDARLIEHTRLAQALDALRCGVVMTNGEGVILHANQAAEEMLRDGTAVQGRGGILNAADAAAAQELRQAIRLAAGDEATLGETGLAVSLGAPAGAPLFAHVLPMTGGNLRTRLQPEAAAAVIIGTATPDLTREDRKDHLRRRYGLTPAEADVALEIARGEGRDACAARLGISTATVRAHLGRIFEKTGVHRQAELTHLLLTGTRETPPAEPQAGKRRRTQ